MIMKRILAGLTVMALISLIALPFILNGQEKKRGAFPETTFPNDVEDENGQRDQFAADQVKDKAGKPVAFDGKRAMGYLSAICDLGPRMSATPAMKKQQALIRKHFEDLGATVRTQNFEAKQISQKKAVPMTNLIVSFFPDRDRRVILSSHYDTRPIADQEDDVRKWREPFLSANDGGSGVAFLMELGHHMKDLPTKVGVDFVFFDGEEYIFEKDRDKYFYGSEHFAQTWKKDKDRCQYVAAVLLDMIAGKGARFPGEGHSLEHAGKLCEILWDIAAEQKCNAFLREVGDTVQDDHISLLRVGIPAVDIIDFSYKHWHRLTDVPANCAPEGMEQVSRVLSVWLQRVK
jgi:glutaminyl-peptide cyclotransferase